MGGAGRRWPALVAVVIAITLLGFFGPRPPAMVAPSDLPAAGHDFASAALRSLDPERSAEARPASLAVPSWINLTRTGPNASPPGTYSGSLSYDPTDQEVVAFGGCDAYVCPQNYTWVFSDGIWTNITNPADAPPARWGAMMDYDPNMGGVLLFGGFGNSGFLNDTWLFSGGGWTNLSWVGPAPAARIFGAFAFDPDPEENGSVLWGGYNATHGEFNDTWVWQSWAGWVLLNTSLSPPTTFQPSMAYDPNASALILYGAGATNSTWELQGGQWWEANIGGPPYRSGAGMVYDPADSAVLLFGGEGSSGYLNDSWTFSDGAWTNSTQSFVTAPPARSDAGLTLDPSGSVPFLFGGMGASTYQNDTWTIAMSPLVALAALPASTEVTTNVTFTATVGEGVAPYVATFHFDDNVTAMVSGDGPTLVATHAFVNPGTYTAWVNVTDSVGLAASSVASPITVAAGPAISASATPSIVDQGQAVAFSATATSPGAPPITYQWTFGDGDTATGASPAHAYAAPGTYPVMVVGTDADGVSANASLSVVVVALPTLTVGDNRSSATVDEPIAFYANLSGGTAPYRFAWNFGDGNRSSFPSPFHVFSKAGTYTVQVWTNDSFSVENHGSLTVSIVALEAPPPGKNTTITKSVTGGVPDWFYPALAGLAVVAVVGIFLLVWRGRSRRSD